MAVATDDVRYAAVEVENLEDSYEVIVCDSNLSLLKSG